MTIETTLRTNSRTQGDSALAATVRAALDRHPPLRMWSDCVQVSTNGDAIVLSGCVRSHSAKETAERLARAAKGVNSVQNQLVVDDELEVAVARALASDPRTSAGFPGILVGVVFGVCYLKGRAPNAAVKSAATEIARGVPGVRSVSNELVVS